MRTLRWRYLNAVCFIEQKPTFTCRLVQAVDTLLEGIDVTSEGFGDVRNNIAGFVVKTEPEAFSGISLFTDAVDENPLSSGKVCHLLSHLRLTQ